MMSLFYGVRDTDCRCEMMLILSGLIRNGWIAGIYCIVGNQKVGLQNLVHCVVDGTTRHDWCS